MSKIQILGTGCPKCKTLYNNAVEAVKLSGQDHDVIKIEKINEIISYGVMSTPALAVDGKVKSTGKLLKPEEILPLLK